MNSTSTQFGHDFAKNLINSFINAIDEGTKKAAQIYWDALIMFLSRHWIAVTVALTVIFIIALVRAMMGRWGMFGSVLYNYFYFGILFIVGWIWGPAVFVSNLFTVICTIALYPLCYLMVGMILNKTGLRRQ